LNGSGSSDIARVLKISPTTVIEELKKASGLESVNRGVLECIKNCHEIQVVIKKCEEAELDEMWSYVGKKSNQRWLWHAIDHKTGVVLAYVSGKRRDKVFEQRKALLDPFGISHYYTDDWGAYERLLDKGSHHLGKRTQYPED